MKQRGKEMAALGNMRKRLLHQAERLCENEPDARQTDETERSKAQEKILYYTHTLYKQLYNHISLR